MKVTGDQRALYEAANAQEEMSARPMFKDF